MSLRGSFKRTSTKAGKLSGYICSEVGGGGLSETIFTTSHGAALPRLSSGAMLVEMMFVCPSTKGRIRGKSPVCESEGWAFHVVLRHVCCDIFRFDPADRHVPPFCISNNGGNVEGNAGCIQRAYVSGSFPGIGAHFNIKVLDAPFFQIFDVLICQLTCFGTWQKGCVLWSESVVGGQFESVLYGTPLNKSRVVCYSWLALYKAR
jgi:hypothetical protein